MNDSDSPLRHNPFETLGELLKDKVVLRVEPPKNLKVQLKKRVTEPVEAIVPSANDDNAFQEAMEGVKPMTEDKHHAKKNNVVSTIDPLVKKPEEDVRQHLDNLVKYGEGFIISLTPEYIEGIGCSVPPEFTERLHRGDFSIQAHLDLHGLGVAQAKEAFENFLNRAIMSGKRGVLIIHGRGISSLGEPVLKNKVNEWLTRSHWRKWVIAFTSAQSHDGGAGATYVLLRHRLTAKGPGKKLPEK